MPKGTTRHATIVINVPDTHQIYVPISSFTGVGSAFIFLHSILWDIKFLQNDLQLHITSLKWLACLIFVNIDLLKHISFEWRGREDVWF